MVWPRLAVSYSATVSVLAETKALARLGGPMVATQFFIMAMGFLDTAMAGHYSSVDLAGVALGGNILWPLFMLFSGLNMALTPIIAQLRGAGRIAEGGVSIRQGIWIGLIASTIMVIVLPNARIVFELASVDPAAADVAHRYLAAAVWGVPGVIVYVSLRYVCEGLGHTLPPMAIAGSALIVNGILNYVFIYGALGVPEMGGEGCGWATALTMWFELALMVALLRAPYFRATGLLDRFEWPNGAEIVRILKIGVPIALTVFLEMAVYSVIGLLIGSMGVTALAAHSIVGHMNWATYVFPMALGSAASIRVGYYVGAREFDRSRHVAKVSFMLSLGYALIVSACLVLGRHALPGIYSNDPAVIELAATLLLFVAVYQIVDDTQATMAGSLRGYKDTRVPMLISLAGYWVVALPLGSALGFGWFDIEPIGVYGFWAGMTLGLILVAISMGVRLLSTSRADDRILALART